MKTVLHVIPSLEGGGAERQLTMLAVEQALRGWQLHVALRRGGVHERRMRDGGVHLHHLGDLRSIHPLLVVRLGEVVRRLDPDLIQTWLPQMDIIGGIVARLSSTPWVLSERASNDAYRDTPLTVWMRTRIAQHADRIVANSPDGSRYWKSRYPEERVDVISNAVDLDAVRNAPTLASVFPDAHTVLLFVGRMSPVKAPEVLLDALGRLAGRRDIHAVFIGDGPLRLKIDDAIATSGLRRRVRVLPYQPDWWGLLKTAAALVSTSRFEGQPNVVLEGMAAGCPLIVSDIPAHRAILDDRSALFVPRDEPAALASAIDSLLADPETTRRRADLASERVADQTIQRAADAYERVYDRILVARPR